MARLAMRLKAGVPRAMRRGALTFRRQFAQEASQGSSTGGSLVRRLGVGAVVLGTGAVAADAWFYSDALGLRARFLPPGAPEAITPAAAPAPATKAPATKAPIKASGPGLVLKSYGILGSSNKEQKVDPPDEDTILVDPAGLPFICGDKGPCDAGGAAQANYTWLEISEAESFPQEVKGAITQECQAKYHAYAGGKKKCIHVVGPDLRQTSDGKEYSLDEAVGKLATAYGNVFEEFCKVGKQQDLRKMRLLPISGGIFSGPFKENLPEMTARAVQAAYDQLSEDKKQHIVNSNIEMCIFMESEFDLFASAFGQATPRKIEKAVPAVPVPEVMQSVPEVLPAAAQREAEAAAAAAANEAAAKRAVQEAQQTVQDALNAMDFHQAILEPAMLTSALQVAEAQVAKLPKEWQEKAQQGFLEARGRLKAADAANSWRQAAQTLQGQLEGADLVALQTALEALTAAEVQLRTQGVELSALGFEASLRSAAQQQLVLLNAAKTREEAKEALLSSLASRHEVGASFEAAKTAGVDVSLPEMRLAKALVALASRPEVFWSSLEDAPATGIMAEDFASAAKEVAGGTIVMELEEHCARLAESLAKANEIQEESGRIVFQESMERLRDRTYERAVKEFQNAHTARRAAYVERWERAVEDSADKVQEAISEARHRLAEEREKKLEDLQQQLKGFMTAICKEDAEDVRRRLGKVEGPLKTLEVARKESIGEGKVSLSAKLLSAAVKETPEALQALQAENSGFVATLLKEVQVDEHPPSVSDIRRSFSSLLKQLAAIALAPPAQTLLGRVASQFLGASFARLYELPTFAAAPEAPASETERNLATLTVAAQLFEADDFSGAITALEALTGDCYSRADAWLRRARQALLWQQTFEALQAKARCLNAAAEQNLG